MKRTRKAILIFLSVIMATLLFAGCKKDASNDQIEAKFTFGYDGTVKIMADNPFVATIKNDGPAFEGELQVVVDDATYSQVIIAMPFEIAENSSKEIKMAIPVYIIQKKFKVYIEVDGEKQFEDEVNIKNILSPEENVMAVITDTADSYRFLENTKLSKSINPNYNLYKYTGVMTQEGSDELEVFYFDSLDQMNTPEMLNFFNYIYIGHNQSLTINEEVEKALNTWIEEGNGLIIETGAEYKKTQSILPSSLNPVKIDDSQPMQVELLWNELVLNDEIEVATSSSLDASTELLGVETFKSAAKTTRGEGAIVTLFVNMGLEPLASWNSKAVMMEGIISAAFTKPVTNTYYDPYYSPYQYMTQQIPSDKQPPYLFMLILFGVYIVIVGPVLYLILKKLDKRDFGWALIPALSVVCIVILFLVGAGTRYQKAIVNSVSILTADENSTTMNVASEMSIFNNKRSIMAVEWNQGEGIELNFSQIDPYAMYNTDPYAENQEKTLKGKMTLGASPKYELYNSSLWTANYTKANKTVPFTPGKIVTMNINEGVIEVTVKNTTPFELLNAFVQWGNGYIFIGDLAPGEEKSVEEKVATILKTNADLFFQDVVGLKPYYNSATGVPTTPSAEQIRTARLYEMVMQRYVYNNYNSYGVNAVSIASLDSVKLCALNDQPVGYELMINGETPDNYATNIVEITGTVEFAKGSTIAFPENLISPTVSYYLDEGLTTIGSFEYQYYDGFVRFYEKGIANFQFQLPTNIDVTEAHVELGELYKEQDYYNAVNGQATNEIEGIIYKVYNYETYLYDEVEKSFDVKDEYISEKGVILVQANFLNIEKDINGAYSYAHMMKLPAISIEGSVK